MTTKPAIVDLSAPSGDVDRVEFEVDAGPTPAVDVSMHKRTRRAEIAVCGTPCKQEQLTDGMDFNCIRCWRIYTATT